MIGGICDYLPDGPVAGVCPVTLDAGLQDDGMLRGLCSVPGVY